MGGVPAGSVGFRKCFWGSGPSAGKLGSECPVSESGLSPPGKLQDGAFASLKPLSQTFI